MPSPAWYNNIWPYRFKITPNAVNGDLYYDFSLVPSSFWDHVRSDGGDIRITKEDGTTEVAREISGFDSTGKKGSLYIATGGGTAFYVYFGVANATEPYAGSTYGSQAVWTGYEAVYHLEEKNGLTVADAKGLNAGTIEAKGLAYYPFNGDYNDKTSNARNLTLAAGSATLANGRLGDANGAYDFSGGLGFTTPANTIPLFSTTSFIVSCWVYHGSIVSDDTYAGSQNVWCSNTAQTLPYIQLTLRNGKYALRYQDANQDKSSTYDQIAGQWNHIVAVFNNANHTLQIFVNGNAGSLQTLISPYFLDLNTRTLCIGRRTGTTIFAGKIDEILIGQITLSSTEIDNWYRKLALHDLNAPFVTGKNNGGMEFLGHNAGSASAIGSLINCGTSVAANIVNQDIFHLSFFAKCVDSDGGDNNWVGFYGGNYKGPMMRLSTNGNVYVQVGRGNTTGTNSNYNANTAGRTHDTDWHLLDLVYDGSYLRTYVDGAQAISYNIGVLIDNGNGGQRFKINANPWDYNYIGAGSYDEVRLEERAPNATEISNRYANLSSPSTFWTTGNVETKSTSTVQRDSGFGIRTTSITSKSSSFGIGRTEQVQKGSSFGIKRTMQLTHDAGFAILRIFQIVKDSAFTIGRSSSVQKSSSFAVLNTDRVTKFSGFAIKRYPFKQRTSPLSARSGIFTPKSRIINPLPPFDENN